MRTPVRHVSLAGVFAFVVLGAYAPSGAPTAVVAAGAQLQSIGPLGFGPNGVMYAADSAGGKIYALDLGAQATGGAPGTANVENFTQKVAAMLGTDAGQIAVTDLVVDARTRNSFVSVMRGQGPDARPALLRVDGAGAINAVAIDSLPFTSVDIPNLPAPNATGRNQRATAITQVKFANGRVWASGLSNEEFASKLWSIPYPFTKADSGTSVEIYHGNHQQLETRAPMYAFIPYTLNNEPYIIGGYLCTPLVKFPVSALKPNSGNKYRGTTIGEFGAGSRPIDMVLYKKDGKDFLLMSNTNRGVMKIPTAGFATAAPITTPVTSETGGVPFEKVAAMTGVVQLDLLDATHSIVLSGNNSALNLRAVELP
ncbi:MAG TPA: hypothetical protein VM818_23190 [Vicinamibacterales bacterium]|nr:hypothetical protein [Vicinamibacterales bacterium]